ncbi:hypothetical protein VSS95_28475, partial [Pseudomonas syringae pv. tagetis]
VGWVCCGLWGCGWWFGCWWVGGVLIFVWWGLGWWLLGVVVVLGFGVLGGGEGVVGAGPPVRRGVGSGGRVEPRPGFLGPAGRGKGGGGGGGGGG